MSFDPSKISQIDVLTDAVRARSLVPLVGAGISRQASPKFPNWNTLLTNMRDDLVSTGRLRKVEVPQINQLLSKNEYLMVAEDLAARYPRDAYERFLAWISTDRNSPKIQGHRRQCLTSSIEAALRSTREP
jgi:hypothetical protein